MALLDCRDTRISLWQPQGVIESPGFVLFDGGKYHFGVEAREQSRVRPRDSSHRFWWQLSTQALKPALGPARHTADLVHSHLQHIHQSSGAPAEIALAVPDSMPREQLSLLLGVAQACDFTVTGLVSRSVLIASTHEALHNRQRVLHLEAQLNQAVLNELVLHEGRVELSRSTPMPACGVLSLQERCVSAIASAFVQQTRYDPRRSAQSEQKLYNMLGGILAEVGSKGEASVDIDGHRARVTSAAVAAASEKLLSNLTNNRQSPEIPLLLDPEFVLFPGISSLPGDTRSLPETIMWDAWSTQNASIELGEDQVHLVHRLAPAAMEGASDPATPAPAKTSAPNSAPAATNADQCATHVLIGAKALPLRAGSVDLGGGFSLRNKDGHWTLDGEGALVNGLPSSPLQPLQLGDTLSLGTAGHGRLIEVVN